jgi:hypothetical protein
VLHVFMSFLYIFHGRDFDVEDVLNTRIPFSGMSKMPSFYIARPYGLLDS